jgi:hypothetical protein
MLAGARSIELRSRNCVAAGGGRRNIIVGVIPSGAVLQAKPEFALSGAEGDLARIATYRQYQTAPSTAALPQYVRTYKPRTAQ